MKQEYPEEFPLPENYLLELGHITVLWANLEAEVKVAINYLSGVGELDQWRVYILTAHCGFQERVDIVETLYKQLQGVLPEFAEFSQVVKLIRAAQKERDRYTHNTLAMNEKKQVQITRQQAQGSLKIKVELVSPSDLKNVSRKIHLAILALDVLIKGVKNRPIWEKER